MLHMIRRRRWMDALRILPKERREGGGKMREERERERATARQGRRGGFTTWGGFFKFFSVFPLWTAPSLNR